MPESEDATKKLIAQLSGLYQKDPWQFEEKRKLLIKQTIESLPAERRRCAYGLQFKIESKLAKYKDPVSRMNKMVEIFWEHFQQFHEVINDPAKFLLEKEKNRSEGKVIQFRRKEDKSGSGIQ